MKEILLRLFAHEELSSSEACSLMLGVTNGDYNDAQLASLLTVFQMRGVTVPSDSDVRCFPHAFLSTCLTMHP